MSRGPSPCVANWPMVGIGPAGGMMPAPHMQQAPHLMPVSGAPPAPYAFGGFFASGGIGMAGGMVGGLQYGSGMTGIMPGYMPSGMHPAMKGSGGGGGMPFGGGMPGGGMHMEYGAGSGAGPMQPMPLPSMWPGDSGTMWLPGGGCMFPMPQGGDGKSQQFCGKQSAILQEPTGQSASGLWSSSGSVQSSQSDFAHPVFPQTVAQSQAVASPQPQQQRQELRRPSMDELPPNGRLSSERQRPQGGQAMDAQAAVPQLRAQRPRSQRRAAQAQQQQQESPQLKANSAPTCKPEPAPPMTQRQAAMQQQQQQAAAMQQGFYDAMGAYGMPGQMPAGMAGLLPGGMAPGNMAGGAMPTGGALPIMVPGVYGSMPNMAVAPLPGAAAASQPQSPLAASDGAPQPQHEQQLQQRLQLGQLATTPRAGCKRTSSGALGSGRGGGGAVGGGGGFRSHRGTPRSEALVLAELKALISQLDPAMKSTMKDSLYRISRHALVRMSPGNGPAGKLSA